MKRTIIAISLSLLVGVGCDRPDIKSDSSKWFGEQTLKDGRVEARRVELPNGTKRFDVTLIPSHIERDPCLLAEAAFAHWRAVNPAVASIELKPAQG